MLILKSRDRTRNYLPKEHRKALEYLRSRFHYDVISYTLSQVYIIQEMALLYSLLMPKFLSNNLNIHTEFHVGCSVYNISLITDTIRGNFGRNDTDTNYDHANHLATSKVIYTGSSTTIPWLAITEGTGMMANWAQVCFFLFTISLFYL